MSRIQQYTYLLPGAKNNSPSWSNIGLFILIYPLVLLTFVAIVFALIFVAILYYPVAICVFVTRRVGNTFISFRDWLSRQYNI